MNNDTNAQQSSPSTLSTAEGTLAVPRVSIDWYRSCPWWRLLSQSIVIAWRASHLVLAAVAICLTYVGWRLGAILFAPEGIVHVPFLEALTRPYPLFEILPKAWSSMTLSNDSYQPITVNRLAYTAFGMLWTIGVWSFAGGMLARRSLMEMGVRTSVGWGPSCRLVCRRWLSMVWATSMPVVGIALLALMPLVLGFIARWGVIGQTIALILMIPTVLLALGIGWCVAIAGLGFPLSVCAIAAEKNADAFDGLSRSAAYVFQRPMTILVALLLAVGLGYLGDSLIRAVLTCGEQVVWSVFAIGFGSNLGEDVGSGVGLRGSLWSLAHALIPTLQAAFLFSFFWTAAAAAYLTLRWEIDHTDFDDLDLQEIGEPVPLPQFKQDARGVSEVVDGSGT